MGELGPSAGRAGVPRQVAQFAAVYSAPPGRDSEYLPRRMPLPVATRFGPFEITGLLGAGGMGEVYRGHLRMARSGSGFRRPLCSTPGIRPAHPAMRGVHLVSTLSTDRLRVGIFGR